MNRNDETYQTYLHILHAELLTATGCTEPAAVAYAAALARRTLGRLPERVEMHVSGNIIKNVRSVSIPNCGDLRGLTTAAAAGVTVADPELQLACLSRVTPEQSTVIREYVEQTPISIFPLEEGHVVDIRISVYAGKDSASIRIAGNHTSVVYIRYNDRVLARGPEPCADGHTDGLGRLSLAGIVAFADCLDPADVQDLLRRQINYNMAIANEGLTGSWGAGIGRQLLNGDQDIMRRAVAYAAAGSDARMSGCCLPVVIVSGSGNQGLATSLPVIIYARHLGVQEGWLFRALAVSNLLTIHQKEEIGRLSAFCGAVNAGCSAAAGVAYLLGYGLEGVSHTMENGLAVAAGIVCDGAKPSCAAKVAMALHAGFLGLCMFQNGQNFRSGDGLVADTPEQTIRNVARVAVPGMIEADREILRIMTQP